MRAQTMKASHIQMNVRIMCARGQFVWKLDFYFSSSLTTPPVERFKPQCLYSNVDWGFGWEITDGEFISRPLPAGDTQTCGGVCFPRPLYCKISNTGVCVCVFVCVRVRTHLLELASLYRKQYISVYWVTGPLLYTHRHTHVWFQIHEPEL